MLKKLLTIITAMAILTACSDKEEVKTNSEVVNNNQESLQANELTNQQDDQQQKEMNEDPSNEAVNDSEWASLPEYNKIVEQMDSQDYTFETETDNEEKRVLTIIDQNGKKQYKSIFIKKTNRLKIIKINGGGLIFNGTLS